MIRSILICSALVASSAAGAVALSVIHDASPIDRSVRTLAPAPVASVETGFVVPAFAPASRPEPQQARVAPAASVEMPVADLAPRPAQQPAAAAKSPVVVKAAPVVRPPVAAKPVVTNQVRSARIIKPRRKAAAKRPTNLPVIVAQAPAFQAAAEGVAEPQYLIGVFR